MALAPWLTPWTVSATNFVVSFAVQTVKISTDTLLQAHVPDALLGHTFSLQDMMYNFGLMAAATLAAWTLPPGGATRWPFLRRGSGARRAGPRSAGTLASRVREGRARPAGERHLDRPEDPSPTHTRLTACCPRSRRLDMSPRSRRAVRSPGSSRPANEGTYVMKFRGAGQGWKVSSPRSSSPVLRGPSSVPVPDLAVITLDERIAKYEADEEVQDLLTASVGHQPRRRLPARLARLRRLPSPPSPDLAERIIWLDALTANSTGTSSQPNLLVWHGQTSAIDHGAALYFHRSWAGRPPSPERFAAQVSMRVGHVLETSAERRGPSRRARCPGHARSHRRCASTTCPTSGSRRLRTCTTPARSDRPTAPCSRRVSTATAWVPGRAAA